MLVDASWEWRKEIALRGKANWAMKLKAVDLLVNNLIRNCKKFHDIYEEKW